VPMSAYLRRSLLRHHLGHATYTAPDTIWLALFSGDPTPDGTGPEIAVARQAPEWTDPPDNVSTLAARAEFPGTPAGTITHAAQMDAEVGGNMLLYGPLTQPKVVAEGTTATVEPGEFTATFV
jgi:hypothetical protein